MRKNKKKKIIFKQIWYQLTTADSLPLFLIESDSIFKIVLMKEI